MTWSRTARGAAVAAALGVAPVLPLCALPAGLALQVSWLVHLATVVVAVVLTLRSARGSDPVLRRPRRLWAAALAAGAAGGLVAVGYLLVDGEVPTPSLADAVTLVWVPLAAGGLLLVPQQEGREVGVAQLLADGLVAASALLFAARVAVVGPLLDDGRWGVLALTSQLAHPLGDVAVGAMVVLLLPRARADLRRVLDVVAAGLLLVALSDAGSLAGLSSRGGPSFGWPDLVLQAGLALLAYAALVPPTVLLHHDERWSVADRHLPYVPVVLASAVGLWHVLQTGALDLGDASFGCVMVAAVLLRQALFARAITAISDEHRYAAGHDALTGLANRKRFFGRLSQHLSTPGAGEAVVLLFDLDGFKEVNDSLGHEAGDQVLTSFARVLLATAPRALVARLGGDEFAALVTGPDAESAGLALGAVVAAGVPGQPADGPPTQVACSVGLARARPGDAPADVLRRADLAMYSAKRSSGGRVVAFTGVLEQQADRRRALVAQVAGAADRGELRLLHLPLRDLAGAALVGAQAVPCWEHPQHGPVGAGELLVLADEAGVRGAVSRWVLEQALVQVAAWERDGLHLPQVVVDVSALTVAELPGRVVDLLARHRLAAGRLVLQVVDDQLAALAADPVVQLLREEGVRLALAAPDSGLLDLVRLAGLVDVVRLDAELLRDRTPGDDVLRAVADLVAALGLQAVTDGGHGRGLPVRAELPEDLALRLPLAGPALSPQA